MPALFPSDAFNATVQTFFSLLMKRNTNFKVNPMI
jgi:hypothetical protein